MAKTKAPPGVATEKLRAAAVLVAEATATLDASTQLCKGCNRLHPTNKVEHQAHQALTQARFKLLDWADTLYLPPDEREDSPAARRIKAERERRALKARED